ncbi:hypothetical protein KOR34_32370 [Posidoniimonas corsicana]|uniref:Uncharacterized protein n=1 Tax=Posidoniimonas corsicana TaxID=1938618 RepID=A0A5C5VI77_9BACT|nr:hypothetical protein [Posidoniimonas corsicana]TWT38268.1 hypothetical protein KOR34_32370 [Posidoniimonas corsicana]
MKACCKQKQRGVLPRVVGAAGGLAPLAGFLLLPKCPLCLAGWIMVLAGVSVSARLAATLYYAIGAALLLPAAVVALETWRALTRRPCSGGQPTAPVADHE